MGEMKNDEKKKKSFWDSVLRAAEVEPRDASSIRGASGLTHPVLAIGVDASRRRVVMISGEADARLAALAQADVQAAMSDVSVLMARPVAINLSQVAGMISAALGTARLSASHLEVFNDESRSKEITAKLVENSLQYTTRAFGFAALSAVAAWKEVIQQLALVEIGASESDESSAAEEDSEPELGFGLTRLIALDPAEYDRKMGVCSVPLYELTDEEVEHFHIGKDIDAVREVLRKLDVLQYFFPAADQLALGLVERSPSSVDDLVSNLVRVPTLGHPYGPTEIVSDVGSLKGVIEALQARGLVVEGELSMELSQSGSVARSSVKFRPREGLLSKISNLVSLKLDISLKDFFR